MAEYIKRTARCKDCLHFDICCEDWAYESEGKYTADEYRATMADKVPCANHFKPTADVVEVVRCKDCSVPHNKWTGCPNLNGLIPPPDFYCAKGEKIMPNVSDEPCCNCCGFENWEGEGDTE